MIRAIDVSVHQGEINWAAVRDSGVRGAWIKVGGADGGLYRDRLSETNRAGARTAGVPFGTYYFANPAPGDAARQAAHAVDCGLGDGALWPALDLEWHNGLSGASLDTFALEFIAEVQRRARRPCLVYTGRWIGTATAGYFGTDPRLGEFALWIANYGTNQPGTTPPAFDPPVPPAWARHGWAAWQFNSSTRIAGVPSNSVDQNVVTDRLWALMTGTPINPEWRMKRILIDGEAAQYRLVDDAFGCLRRQHVDSLELANLLDRSGATDGELVLTDPAEIDRFRRIPETPTNTTAELGLINVVAKGVAAVNQSIAAIPGSTGGPPLDEDELADRIARHLGEHLRE